MSPENENIGTEINQQPTTDERQENAEVDASGGQIEPQGAESLPEGVTEPAEVPFEAPEAPTNVDDAVLVNNDFLQNEGKSESTNDPNQQITTNGESASALRTGTDRPATGQAGRQTPEEQSAHSAPNEPIVGTGLVAGILALRDRAMEAIQFRKRRKLEKIMMMLGPTSPKATRDNFITNDKVEKLLHVSDATATRYLNQLVKEGRLVSDKKGRGTVYRKP